MHFCSLYTQELLLKDYSLRVHSKAIQLLMLEGGGVMILVRASFLVCCQNMPFDEGAVRKEHIGPTGMGRTSQAARLLQVCAAYCRAGGLRWEEAASVHPEGQTKVRRLQHQAAPSPLPAADPQAPL